MDAYEKGLDGQQAMWAAKKYHSHQVLLPWFEVEMEKAGLGNIAINI